MTIDEAEIIAIGSIAVLPPSPGTAAATTIINVGTNDCLRRRRSDGSIHGMRRICDDHRRRLGRSNDSRRRRRGQHDRDRFLGRDRGCRERRHRRRRWGRVVRWDSRGVNRRRCERCGGRRRRRGCNNCDRRTRRRGRRRRRVADNGCVYGTAVVGRRGWQRRGASLSSGWPCRRSGGYTVVRNCKPA